jgi:hypothetical protein
MGNILLACNGGGEQRASLAPGMLAETEQLLRHRHRADDATVRRVLDYAAAVVEGGEGTCGGCGLVLQLLLVTPCGHLVCPECVPAACVGCPVCAAPFAPVAYTACARCEAAGTPGCDAAHEGRRPRSMGGVDAFVWLQPGFSLDWQAPHYIVHHTVHCMVRVAAAGPRPRLAGDATRRGGAPARAGDAPAARGRGGGGAARQGRRAVERGCASGERAEGARNSPGRRSGCPRCPRDGRSSCDLAGRRLVGGRSPGSSGGRLGRSGGVGVGGGGGGGGGGEGDDEECTLGRRARRVIFGLTCRSCVVVLVWDTAAAAAAAAGRGGGRGAADGFRRWRRRRWR